VKERRLASPVRSRQGEVKAGSAEVRRYIAGAPAEARKKLQTIRKVIRSAVPKATEVISYSMPGYCYLGYDYKGMFVWFALQSSYIGLYLRPPTIGNHRDELRGYVTTKSAVHLPLDRPIPATLVRKLVRASERVMKSRSS
jgi:uncharacterized protein YdhG (YjbR/CyaY superfamily)